MENAMSKKPLTDTTGVPNETAAATLAALATQIGAFVREGTLDSRCATRLVKRLKKEADTMAENSGQTKPDQKALKNAFKDVDAALRDHDAGLLVKANAALRATEDVSTTPTAR
jgi:hypothetical protein